jgi:acetyl esterase/lipase
MESFMKHSSWLLTTVVLLVAGFGFPPENKAVVAEEPREIVLWPNGHPEPKVSSDPAENLQTAADGLTRRFNVSGPRLFVHSPREDKATGAAVIIVPGGGFGRLSDEHEGSDVSKWLTSHGIVALQLAYRTPTNKHSSPVLGPAQDLQQAIRVVREQAADLKVDPQRIAVLGFSAGGQTALVATAGSVVVPQTTDGPKLDPGMLKPNLLLLIYPYQVLNADGSGIRNDVNLESGLPPTFIAQALDDKASPPIGSAKLFIELTQRNVLAELHIYQNGGHGFGMRPRAGAPGSKDWSDRALDWLRLHKFAAPEAE